MRDYDDCLAIFDSNVPKFFAADERPKFVSFLQTMPGPFIVLADSVDQIVGGGGYAVREGTGVADLLWGMIRTDLHGLGLGRVLAKYRIDRIHRDATVSRVVLETSHHTVGFYEGLGFTLAGVVADGYGPGLDRCEMRLDISRPRFGTQGS